MRVRIIAALVLGLQGSARATTAPVIPTCSCRGAPSALLPSKLRLQPELLVEKQHMPHIFSTPGWWWRLLGTPPMPPPLRQMWIKPDIDFTGRSLMITMGDIRF